MPAARTRKAKKVPCPYGCRGEGFGLGSGLTQHINAAHSFNVRTHATDNEPADNLNNHAANPSPRHSPVDSPPPQSYFPMDEGTPEPVPRGRHVDLHPKLTGRPCDRDGNFLHPDAAPLPKEVPPPDDFGPYRSLNQFRMADFLYRKVQMSAGEIDEPMEILDGDGNTPPFTDHKDLYATIDATERGHVAWQAFEVAYDGSDLDAPNAPSWKRKNYTVYFRDPRAVLQQQLGNPDYKSEIDLSPRRVYDEKDERVYENFMSGDWAWRQADDIAKDPGTHGSVFVPVISGSDKTTTSVATGQNDFYPLYLSNGLVHNTVRRAHRNAVSLIGFLATPKTGNDDTEVVFFGDGHYRRVIYGLGPYIADYPEQVLLACVVQGWCARCHASNKDLDGEGGRRTQAHAEAIFDAFDHKTLWDQYGILPDPFTWDFPRADIYELLSPDLLHQIIKGTFKDHLVTWVGEYLELVHGKATADKIMADIDRRIAAVPPFPGIRRFHEGRGFKQWTGDDSKALMKVYLPAIEGHVPAQMLRAFSAFLDFCYLVRRNTINATTLHQIEEALACYHTERAIFEASGVCPTGFCLPRQHSLTHYVALIMEFGAPNGLCSSITESKHIKAVKEPWRRSSKYEALHQMLTINDRLDNLASTRVDFEQRGILHPNTPDPVLPVPISLPSVQQNDDDEDHPENSDSVIEGEVRLAKIPIRGYPRDPNALAIFLDIPSLPSLICRFLYTQLHPDDDISLIDPTSFPPLPISIMTYPSAIATFYAPSDQSNARGLLHERIRAVDSWRGGPPRYDCVYVSGDDEPGFRGLMVARTLLFMSFKYERVSYQCALVTWFSPIGEGPCPDVGMWMVDPDVDDDSGERVLDVIHVDTILRAAHLIPVFGEQYLPSDFQFTDSLDSFQAYYVNKYADHHSHEIVF
ncbi:hypothetical protein GGX14DRAFT_536413 [Mycena pura]|uniref:C2H2-type domain-containing protein n=1 Tax=Mycena pura TaxID=153505 RepID=A0AAD6Y3X8_9AGAR|nr:hypothetical protein GGX14DRAFT_536413 [Mycena pura]